MNMKVILKKLLHDFWLAKGKLLLLIIAASLAIWGISSVVYSYLMSERDFQVNFARTFPADIEILVENYVDGLIEKFLADEQVVDVERREVLGGRMERGDGSWMPFILYGVEDVGEMRMDVFRILEEDAKVPGKILIEQNARFFLEEGQDSIRIQFPQKGEITWRIGGTSHDARLAPARMERAVFAHATSLDLMEPYLRKGERRLLIETKVSTDKKRLQDVAARIKTIGAQAGSKVSVVAIPEPGKHIHQNIVDGISFLQKSMGFILALMGIILLSLILLTWIFPRIGEVGVMKAVGASTQRIFYGYLCVFLMIIAIGLLIGMPLGYKTAILYNNFVAFIQNFEPVRTLLPFSSHVLVIFLSILIPLLVALMPISKAANTTVNEAINKTFYLPNKSIFQFSQKLVATSKIRYGLNNLFRSTQRTLLLLFLIAVGVGLFFTGSNLDYSVEKELEAFAASAYYRLRVRFPKVMTKEELAFLTKLSFVESSSIMMDKKVTYQPPNAAFTETKNIRILSSDHIFKKDFILKGKVDKHCTTCIYICGEAMRQTFEEVDLGTTINLTFSTGETRSFTYSGIFKDLAAIGSPFFLIDDKEVETFNALAFAIKPGFSGTNISNSIDDALLENGIDLLSMIDVNTRMGQLQGHLEPTYLILKVSGIFTVFIGFFGLLIVLNLTIQERTREIGIMKSLGCSRPKIIGLFRMEFLWVTSLAIFLGFLLAIPFTKALCTVLTETVIFLHIPFQNHFQLILASVLFILLIQIVLITLYTRAKIKRNARILLGHQF